MIICIFTCKTIQVGKSAFGQCTGGESDPPWQRESKGEDRCVSVNLGAILRMPPEPAWGTHKGDPELCCLAEIQRCEINVAFSQQNTGNFRG